MRARACLFFLLLVFLSLACGSASKVESYQLRGWTTTPSVSPFPTQEVVSSVTPVPLPAGPTIIYVLPTPMEQKSSVIANVLEVREGPGEGHLSVGFLNGGDEITIIECAQDENGESWARITSPVNGWVAATWGNKLLVKPSPGGCK